MRPSLATLSLAVLLGACTADTFSGQDAGLDGATIEAGKDASVVDAVTEDVIEPSDGETGDAKPLSYCEVHSTATFCDDFDDASETTALSKWSFATPASPPGIAFAAGLSGRDVATVSSGAVLNTFLTKQLTGPALHALALDVNFPQANDAITLVRVTASTKTFALTTDPLGGNFIATGDSGTQATLSAASVGWHHFDVQFGSNTAIITQDNGTKTGSVSFPPSTPTTYALDIGIIVSTLGGKVAFDNVRVN